MAHSESKVIPPPVGKNVKAFRQRKKITQMELVARLIDLGWHSPSDVVVYKIESGIRKINTHELSLLAKALECDMGDLLQDCHDSE